ncbi:transthyretin-like protein-like protein [Rhexocercosporidium sp. MPI-PUGE-AT-0058]|nr:transthyretin-like protein-like protein [Rhexocercosporidium sp. MPI-PUGE-AT-0058]
MSTATRPPITCHVLDTTTGRPAANLEVKLSCCDFPDIIFEGTTNTDGRIASWGNKQGTAGEYVVSKGGFRKLMLAGPIGSSLWKLQFNTGAHYGIGNTFFPIVELSFLVVRDEHFHVPLLLGPYSFTTYRGS